MFTVSRDPAGNGYTCNVLRITTLYRPLPVHIKSGRILLGVSLSPVDAGCSHVEYKIQKSYTMIHT